jgi:uncharacterized membrane protein YoaK (UPF0700 family)
VYRLEPQDYIKKRFIGLWSLLAFQAGFINSIGFLACQRYVSHVTGFDSQVGISLGQGRPWLALELACAPLSFVGGAWLCGHLTVARKARGLVPRYDLITLLMPAALLALMLAGIQGYFGPFGEPLILARDLVLLYCLSFLCGSQNATFATLTQGQIRTTHLTGISTDFGTDLALILSGQLPEAERRTLRYKNLTRALTFSSFSVGALVSALWDTRLGYASLAVPSLTATVVAAVFWAGKLRLNRLESTGARIGQIAVRDAR